MRAEGLTSKHLLLAGIVSAFSATLILMTVALSWELWMIPLIAAGVFSVWLLHIGRIGSEKVYDNLCAGLILTEFFFFGVHSASLFDIPAMACLIIFIFTILDRKRLLYMTVAFYALELLYHALISAHHHAGHGPSGHDASGLRRCRGGWGDGVCPVPD